ncbi:MAG: hypothetical protein PUB39_00395 [Eubacteriales bacterium]|nr:hypothetical protein [Eubacteriales bacterium]
MSLFEKKVPVFKKRDKETWKQIRIVLKEAGIKGVSAGHYTQEGIIAGGCASQIDPRDMGAKGKIDRDVYYINVKQSEFDRAQEVIRSKGIVAEVLSTDEIMKDGPERHKADLNRI